MYWWSLERDF